MSKPLHALPLHHIDTSIFLEPRHTEAGRACQKYLQKVGYNYRGEISLPVLGEMMISLLRLAKYNDRQDLLEWIVDTVNMRKIGQYIPVRIGAKIEEIKDLDQRINPTDMQIVACAIEAKADVLVTLDVVLLENQKLHENYKLQVSHPEKLV